MTDLQKLMSLPGALAAFEFSDRGELGEHQIAAGSSLICHALGVGGRDQSHRFVGLGFSPFYHKTPRQ